MYLLTSPKRSVVLHRAALPLCLVMRDSFPGKLFAFPLPIAQPLADGILLVPLYMALILALASDPIGIGRMLSNRVLVLLGEASFAFLSHSHSSLAGLRSF